MGRITNKKLQGVFSASTVIGGVLGACVLILVSYLQKLAVGFNPYLIKAYITPAFIGCLAGCLVGIYVYKLRHASNELQESEEKYRSMMESMGDAAYICSSDL